MTAIINYHIIIIKANITISTSGTKKHKWTHNTICDCYFFTFFLKLHTITYLYFIYLIFCIIIYFILLFYFFLIFFLSYILINKTFISIISSLQPLVYFLLLFISFLALLYQNLRNYFLYLNRTFLGENHQAIQSF